MKPEITLIDILKSMSHPAGVRGLKLEDDS